MSPTEPTEPTEPTRPTRPTASAGAFPILVTGASGNVGGALAGLLRERGLPFRAAGTRPEKLRARFPGVDAVELDLNRPDTFAPALQGMKGLFLVRPPAVADVKRTLAPLVDEALRQGVEHVVFLSLLGAANSRVVPHRAVERHLEASDASWTFLRAGFFATNLADAYRQDILDGCIRLPAGRGRVAFVDGRDLAEAALKAFEAPAEHRRSALDLTGGEAVDFDQVAALLTDVLGRPVRYEAVSTLRFLAHRRRQGTPWAMALIMALLHRGLRKGAAERIDPTLERLLGRPPRTLRTYVEDHAALWRRDGEGGGGPSHGAGA